MEKKKTTSLELSQGQAQRQDLRLFAVLACREREFLEQTADLEADPLFARLCLPGRDGSAPVIRRRMPGASYAFSRACGDDALAAAACRAAAGDWLADRPEMLELARRAGAGKFEKFFLSDAFFSAPAIARACGMTPEQASALKAFVDAFILAHERVSPAALPGLYLRCAAEIRAEDGKLSASYLHPSYFRGAYRIDRPALARLVRSGSLTPAEARKASALLSRAQRLAWRRGGLHRLLGAIMEAQSGFLLRRSGLRPLTQRDLAVWTGLDPATVSRLIADKTVLTPWGQEMKLKGFFLARSAFIIDKIKGVLGGASAIMTDTELAAALMKNYGLRVPRRTVNHYRSKL